MSQGGMSLSSHNSLISESAFKKELDVVAAEVHEAVYIHQVMEEINRLALNDPNILLAMNEQPLFWQAHRATSQAALFMSLGRIFDTNEATTSIYRLIRITRANIQVFSKAALEARKRGPGPEPPWLNAFLKGIWEPQTAEDLKFLKEALKPHAKLFESVYKPIRHSVYGHRLVSDDEAGIALFPQTNREAIGKILDFLHDLVESINELYLNGTKPELGRDFKEYNQRIRDDARNVMRRLAERVVLDKNEMVS
jgi:hypothetical protein